MNNPTSSAPVMTTGLDLGDTWCHYFTLRADGSPEGKGRVRNDREELRTLFGTMSPHRVVIEVGVHSAWIGRLLAAAGQEVIVANPRRTRLISENSSKTDFKDAELLARLGRTDPKLLSPITHRSAEKQADLSLVHARGKVVEARAMMINHVRGTLKSAGVMLKACSADAFSKRAAGEIPEALKPALAPLVGLIADLTLQIRNYDREVERLCDEQYSAAAHLTQVPGVGALTALTFVLTLDNPARFRDSRRVGSYLGLRPRKQESSSLDPQLHITKEGSPLLRRLLVQSAHYNLGPFGPETDLRRFGMGLMKRGGKTAKKRACVAVARKLAVLLHRLWVTGTDYEPLREARRREARGEKIYVLKKKDRA